ncbi:MAG: hypothetical protein KDK62_05165 [Chlamydiia bacterium]|nr:hypothetical protein [Chlamydiia bacterium]
MKYILPLIALFLSGCCTGFFDAENEFEILQPTMEPRIDAEEFSRTVIRFSTYLKREKGLQLEDSRLYYTDCAERLRLVYSTQKIIDLCAARELLVDVVEGFLEELNSNSITRSDLCDNYFTADNLEVYINFESYYTEYVDPFMVAWIVMDQGLATYYMGTLKQWYYDRWHNRVEPYYKSLQFVEAQREADMIYPPPLPEHLRNESRGPINIETGPPRNGQPRFPSVGSSTSPQAVPVSR